MVKNDFIGLLGPQSGFCYYSVLPPHPQGSMDHNSLVLIVRLEIIVV